MRSVTLNRKIALIFQLHHSRVKIYLVASLILDYLSEGNSSYSYCGFKDLSYELIYYHVLDEIMP